MSATYDVQRAKQLVDDVVADDPDATDPFSCEPPTNKLLPDYLPTPRRIRDECRRIREGWSEEEHWKRAGYHGGRPNWEVRRSCPPASELR